MIGPPGTGYRTGLLPRWHRAGDDGPTHSAPTFSPEDMTLLRLDLENRMAASLVRSGALKLAFDDGRGSHGNEFVGPSDEERKRKGAGQNELRDSNPDHYLNKDLSGLSDRILIRDLIITRTMPDELMAEGDFGYSRAIIRELMARGWTENEILERANNAPWIDKALQVADEAVRRYKAKEQRRK